MTRFDSYGKKIVKEIWSPSIGSVCRENVAITPARFHQEKQELGRVESGTKTAGAAGGKVSVSALLSVSALCSVSAFWSVNEREPFRA